MATEMTDKYMVNIDGCWVWKTTQANGYGRVTINGKRQLAHRVMYEMLVGSIPHGMELDHICRNRSCANPEHLEAVTHAENVRRGMSPRIVAWRAGTCEKGHSNRYVDASGKTVCRDCRNRRKRDAKSRR